MHYCVAFDYMLLLLPIRGESAFASMSAQSTPLRGRYNNNNDNNSNDKNDNDDNISNSSRNSDSKNMNNQ